MLLLLCGQFIQTGDLFGQTWSNFSPEGSMCKVLFPKEPAHQSQTVDTEVGQLSYHSYVINDTTRNSSNVAYVLSYCDYPVGTIHSDSLLLIPDFFNATIDESILSLDGELVYSDEDYWVEYPGRIWKVAYQDGRMMVKNKSYLVKNRLYTIQVYTLKEKDRNRDINRYLDSFKLVTSSNY
ncbi:MAG: hypothetical protein HKN67_01545 [Saprospiraceae bacterium]|nr:hypothetical protein [Saprospiraceae bacterium]